MLSQQDIQQLKNSAPSSGGIPNNQALDDNTFNQWVKSGTSTPPPPSSYDVAMGKTNPDGTPNTDKGIIPQAVDQFKSGFSQVSQGVKSGNLGDIGRGVLNEAGGGLRAVFSPIEAATKVVSKLPGVSQVVGATNDHIIKPLADTISNSPQLQQFMQSNPHADEIVGNLLAVGGSLVGGGKAQEIKGAVSDAGSAIADTTSNIANKAIDTVGSVSKKIDSALPSTNLLPKSDEIMNRVARLNPSDANKFKDMSGMTHGEYLAKSGNFGSPDKIISNEAIKFVNSLNTVDSEMAKLPGQYTSAPLKTALDELVARENRVSSEGAPSPDLARAEYLKGKNDQGGLTMAETNEAKRLYEKNVKLGYAKDQNNEGVARATNIDSALRTWQFDTAKKLGLKNLDELNKQTQMSKFIVDKLGKQLTGKTGNDALGLTDWIMLSGGSPTSVAGFLTKKFFSSKTVQAKVAQMISKDPTIKPAVPDTTITSENINRQVNPRGNLALPAPTEGAPTSSINTQINMPSRKAINSGTEIVPKAAKQSSKKR